ncbi:transcriptional regulator [Companilactobacillus tucceti DSM 20183]|uniref:Transcriptional regulator n=1 Tax=Companilactobacillus tucceti DSM 20183 TaxID=1423811 RepID=A0A0R1J6F7_9LACO|nr:MerR family transcriptional regulator [Companilactobacillus tucceti]KRK64017.1 transcriptional regulator [Companilactobacillus tucceti DSM 20183]
MSYTTGEIAKAGKVSVKTIQFYDKKNLLNPSSRTENGRRLYNDQDLKKLKLILLLKSMGLTLDSIRQILVKSNSSKILTLLLDEQEKKLKNELNEAHLQIKIIEKMKKSLPSLDNFSIKSIDDIDYIMENKKSLRKLHIKILGFGLILDVIEIGTLIVSLLTGNWIWFGLGMVLVVIAAVILTKVYYQNTNYICPNCNTEFKPSFKQSFFAKHNLKTRKLTCPNCGKKDFCVEVYDKNKAGSYN